MEYSRSMPLPGDPGKALDLARGVLTGQGFALTASGETELEFVGPGLRSTRQNPLLGASLVRIHAGRTELTLEAELGGVAGMRRFLGVFPPALGLGLAVFFGGVMGVMIGRQTGVGFGAPFAPGWRWLAFAGLVSFLPVAPWLVLSPLVARSLERRTVQALDTLLANMSIAAGGTAGAAFDEGRRDRSAGA